MRAFRGLVLVFALSFLSLVGVLLTVTALGGLGEWTRWQFIGLFGAIEAASGFANIILPNIWRLPVAEVQTRSTKVRLAASTVLIPHWGGGARAAAGIALVGGAAVAEGVGPATFALPIVLVLLAVIVVAVSAAVARAGVERPDLDVVQFVIRRPRQEVELPPVSIGASVLQFVLSIITIPAIKALPPTVLFQPEIGPSWPSAMWLLAAAAVSCGLVVACWFGRIDWHAPREQQREAEKFA